MIKIIVFILIFIITILVQYYFSKHNQKQKISTIIDDEIDFNKKNRDKLEEIIKKTINERLKLLEKMDYNEWIEYNKKNNYIKIDNYKYYISIYQLVINNKNFINSTFINKVHYTKRYNNLFWKDIVSDIENIMIYEKYNIDKNLIQNQYINSKNKNKIVFYDYKWIDHENNIFIIKNTYSSYWEKDNISGVISVGYTYDNDTVKYKNSYFLKKYVFYIIIFSILIITLSLFFGKNILYSIIFYIIINIIFFHYINSYIEISSYNIEYDKIKNINRGVLGITFLSAVIIFILRITSNNNKTLNGYLIMFLFSILFILIATYKTKNYGKINELISIRVTKQISFNFAVTLIIFIVINYLFFISRKI